MRRAFTLLELLVVLGILALLLGLLLPAVQKVRAAADRLRCQSQLRQIALGWHSHESAHGYFPGGGLGWWYPPDYIAPGNPIVGPAQRAGWGFQVLPFLEQESAWRGGGATTIPDCQRRAIGALVPLYFCPSRGRPRATGGGWYGPPGDYPHAQCDYAANGGSEWGAADGVVGIGVCKALTDLATGTSNTLMLGEKFLLHPFGADDNEGYSAGYDVDTVRFTGPNFPPAQREDSSSRFRFGGLHPGGWAAAFADGHVEFRGYSDGDHGSNIVK